MTVNLANHLLHILGTGASAYVMAANLRDPKSRPNLLAGFQLAESGSVPFLETLSRRAADEGDAWLAERLSRHADDERRHGQIFAHALKLHGKRARDPEAIARSRQGDGKSERGGEGEGERSPFFAAFFEGYDREALRPEKIDWPVFFGSTYILELDASRDFPRMAAVLPEGDRASATLKQSLLSVGRDETRHAAYLREAMHRHLSFVEVESSIRTWRDRKTRALIASTTSLLQKGGRMAQMAEDGDPGDRPAELAARPAPDREAAELAA